MWVCTGPSDRLVTLEWAPPGHRRMLLTASRQGCVTVWTQRPNESRAASLAPFQVSNEYHAHTVQAAGEQLLMGTWLHEACQWRWRAQVRGGRRGCCGRAVGGRG